MRAAYAHLLVSPQSLLFSLMSQNITINHQLFTKYLYSIFFNRNRSFVLTLFVALTFKGDTLELKKVVF